LREQYIGTVNRLINYFTLLAEDVREILAGTWGIGRLEGYYREDQEASQG